MARSGKREPTEDAAERVADAADALESSEPASGASGASEAGAAGTSDAAVDEAVTEVRLAAAPPIPPLLTDDEDAAHAAETDVRLAETFGAVGGVAPDPDPIEDPVLPEVPGEREAAAAEGVASAEEANHRDRIADAASSVAERAADRAGLARERAAEQAGAVRDRASEHAGAVREKAAEHASAAREKLSESAGEARERLADGAAEAKIRGAKMRKRFAATAADARDQASSAAAQARERVANADVNEFAHSTTRLIDQARPFFLAGFAAVFAVLGFLEGDSGTAEMFVGGAILFVIGAGFSGEINAHLNERLHHTRATDRDEVEPRRNADDHRDGPGA